MHGTSDWCCMLQVVTVSFPNVSCIIIESNLSLFLFVWACDYLCLLIKRLDYDVSVLLLQELENLEKVLLWSRWSKCKSLCHWLIMNDAISRSPNIKQLISLWHKVKFCVFTLTCCILFLVLALLINLKKLESRRMWISDLVFVLFLTYCSKCLHLVSLPLSIAASLCGNFIVWNLLSCFLHLHDMFEDLCNFF